MSNTACLPSLARGRGITHRRMVSETDVFGGLDLSELPLAPASDKGRRRPSKASRMSCSHCLDEKPKERACFCKPWRDPMRFSDAAALL